MQRHIALIYQNVHLPFIFEEAIRSNLEITLIHAPHATVPSNLPGVSQTVGLDIFADEGLAFKTLADLHRRKPFAGVLTLWDAAVAFTARAAQDLFSRNMRPMNRARLSIGCWMKRSIFSMVK